MQRLLCIVGGMNVGGAETFLMKLYGSIDCTKYQMDFAVAEQGAYDTEILQRGGKLYRICPKSRGALQNYRDIRSIVKQNGYTSVLRVSQSSLSALELLAAKQGGAKIRVFRSSNTGSTRNRKKDKIVHRLCRFMPLLFANRRLAPSTEAAEYMFGKGAVEKGRAQLLHNALDLRQYAFDAAARQTLRKQFGERLLVGHIGRFNQQKNHAFLLEVFARLVQHDPQALLLLLGQGELEAQIRTRAAELGILDSIRFLGVRNDVSSWLSAMDVFVFPSLYEGMPNTVIEAQAAGLPCLISDTITREADVTGLVRYLPLCGDAELWAQAALEQAKIPHKDTTQCMTDAGYDIRATCRLFERIVFDEKE